MAHNRIMFVPTNGSGLGHLTRLLAIARRMKKLEKKLEIIFLSTSPAMHLIMREGFLGYYLPARRFFPDYVSSKQWNTLLGKELSAILKLHSPNMLVFDGVVPYGGIVSSLKEVQNMKRVWIRRVQNKKESDEKVQKRGNKFHKIIVPGEAGIKFAKGNDKIHYCEPVIYLDKSELISRESVRKQWGVKEDEKLVYIQLGAGNINDINSVISLLVSILEKRKDVRIILGESIIGKRLVSDNNKVTILRDYPNSIYYKAFDLAVSAAGYNTYHELMYLGVPSIFIPNEIARLDDPVGRALTAERAGAGICLRSPNSNDIVQALEKGLDPKTNQKMREAAKQLAKKNGADEIAKLLLKYNSQK